ncbi:hypothetical protein D3C75_1387970 [compost metagenome]
MLQHLLNLFQILLSDDTLKFNEFIIHTMRMILVIHPDWRFLIWSVIEEVAYIR